MHDSTNTSKLSQNIWRTKYKTSLILLSLKATIYSVELAYKAWGLKKLTTLDLSNWVLGEWMTFKFSQRERDPKIFLALDLLVLVTKFRPQGRQKRWKTKQNIKPEGKILYIHSQTTLFNKVNNTKI